MLNELRRALRVILPAWLAQLAARSLRLGSAYGGLSTEDSTLTCFRLARAGSLPADGGSLLCNTFYRDPAAKSGIREYSKKVSMKLTTQIKEAAATGYILLWLLGIPIPILLIIFLLRGCT